MSIKGSIKDGTGTDVEAKVARVGRLEEEAVYVNIAGVSPGFSLPTGPGVTGERFQAFFSLNGAGAVLDAAVDGSVTPQNFELKADETRDIIITEILIEGVDNGIKLANFLGLNSSLTNGVDFYIQSDNIVTTIHPEPITSTNGIKLWSSLSGFDLDVEAGGDSAKGTQTQSPALPVRVTGTFGSVPATDDDILRVIIQDDLTSVVSFRIMARGVYAVAGVI